MAPLAKPGQSNWRRRTLQRLTALRGNGKVRGVPPIEIWDDGHRARPWSRTVVRARMGVWLASSLLVTARWI